MANKGSWLAAGAYLREGDALVSDNGLYQATLRGGDFKLNQGPDLGGYTYWRTNTVLPYWATAGFATLQSDGNFVLCSGSDPAHPGALRWSTGVSNGQVKINNQGGYSASCEVNWQFNGQNQTRSNDTLLLGQTLSVELPVGAYNVQATCTAYTGLVWNPSNLILSWNESPGVTAPLRVTFNLTGTTLNPSYNVQ